MSVDLTSTNCSIGNALFNEERIFIASLFGAKHSDRPNIPFSFDIQTNAILGHWLNYMTSEFTAGEIKIIYTLLLPFDTELQKNAPHIWEEIKQCINKKSGWYIY